MPVTAKLSRKFYETFGDDVVNELVALLNGVDATYRLELRELHELNFARFDAKLEQRMAELRAELLQRIAELRADLRTEFERRFTVAFRLSPLQVYGSSGKVVSGKRGTFRFRGWRPEMESVPIDLV